MTANLCQYFTPEWAAAALVEQFYAGLSASDLVVEPSCGRGAWLKAIPDHVPAIGVEIDEALARQAEADTGRRVYVGDFRTVAITEAPTVVLGNPPFDLDVVESFLQRAARLLPENGRCGFLLPAYAMQTHGRVMRLHETWSMAADLVPRRIFPRLREPLLFVRFQKERIRRFIGFSLYQEATELRQVGARARLVLVEGRPRMGVWRALVEAMLQDLGGRATLQELYAAIEPRRPLTNRFWEAKVRQTVQLYCRRLDRGVWALAESAQ
ncbi:MAG: class I SAM-dependent methyltransferase [Candidatus Methylomirabilales bacterium]